MQLGIHQADTLRYWLGPVRRVQGSFARTATTAEIDDVGLALLEFAGGARATLSSTYGAPKTFYLRLFGTEANLHYETDMSVWPRADQMDAATSLTLHTKTGSEAIDFAPRDMLVEEMEEFAACIRGETTPETGPNEALAADMTLVDVLSCADRFHKTRRASLSNRSSCPSRTGDDTKPKRR